MKFKSTAFSTILILLFFSCNKEDQLDENQIKDSTGITIDFKWNSGGSDSNSLSEVNLDIILFTISPYTLIDSSKSLSAFETLKLPNTKSDKTYYVSFDYVSGTIDVTYTIDLKGTSSEKKITYTGNIPVPSGSSYLSSLAKIEKVGDIFTIENF